MQNTQYIYANNVDVFSKYSVSDSSETNKVIKPLSPVFQVNKIDNTSTNYILEPGYLDFKRVFYPCPIQIFYVLVKRIYCSLEDNSENGGIQFTLEFKLFGKQYKKHIGKKLTFRASNDFKLDYRCFDKVVNLLNVFVESGRDIYLIDIKKIEWFDDVVYSWKFNLREKVKHIIEHLHLEAFENRRRKVGDDDRYWEEIEVKNIPEELYLKNLLERCLALNSESLHKIKDGFMITRDTKYAFLDSYTRIKLQDYDFERLKTDLMMDFYKLFKIEDFELDRIMNFDFKSLGD